MAPRPSRRRILQWAGAAVATVGANAVLTACGGGGGSAAGAPRPPTEEAVRAFWAGRRPNGTLRFANWPLYMDRGATDPHQHPSLEVYAKQHSTQVHYHEVIVDNATFLRQISPALAAGKDPGYDLAVITGGIAFNHLRDQGYLVALDRSRLGNFTTFADPAFTDPSYDPGNVYSVPWQSGITGIAYNPAKVHSEPTSYRDLFDRRYRGRVGMLADSEDLANSALLALGIDPPRSKVADWRKAAAHLQAQKQAGIVRRYYNQDYITALAKGDTWISLAWSGDIPQANATGAPGLRFVVPEEGGLLWTDNMVILKGAANPVDAIRYMDFVYRPTVAEVLAEAVEYITPVNGSRALVQQDAAGATGTTQAALQAIAANPLIYPSGRQLAAYRRYRTLTNEELPTWNALFQPIYQV